MFRSRKFWWRILGHKFVSLKEIDKIMNWMFYFLILFLRDLTSKILWQSTCSKHFVKEYFCLFSSSDFTRQFHFGKSVNVFVSPCRTPSFVPPQIGDTPRYLVGAGDLERAANAEWKAEQLVTKLPFQTLEPRKVGRNYPITGSEPRSVLVLVEVVVVVGGGVHMDVAVLSLLGSALILSLVFSLFLSTRIALGNHCLVCAEERKRSRVFYYLPSSSSSSTRSAVQTVSGLLCVCVCV